MDHRSATPGGHQTPGIPTSKLSSRRPQISVNPLRPAPAPPLSSLPSHVASSHRSPPLTSTSRDNQRPEPGHVLPKEGGVGVGTRLKIKSTPSAESRYRTPLGPRTSAYGSQGASSGLGGAVVSAARRLHRAITPSVSGGSWAEVGALAVEENLDEPWEMLKSNETVLVTVRVRPPNQAELSRDGTSVWDTPGYDDHLIKLAKGRDGGRDEREWVFDRILDSSTDNARAYVTSARAHVRSAMDGYNAVIFAYGQTASGKTFTLSGSPSSPGIIPLSVSDLFAGIRSTPDREFLLRASYLELYNETILDLLSPGTSKELSLSEGKKKGDIIINGLTECAVRTEDEVKRLLRLGEERRKVGGTDWNTRSSRSHCVFRIVIESRAARPSVPDDGSRTPGGGLLAAGDKMTRISTLSIIDLAGSEKHTSSKERNAEGKHINQSLLTLKLVISKLADLASKRNITHIPYRDSKLTRLLQPSLSGDALISVICTVSPSAVNLAESLSTLAFAQGLKRVMLRAEKKEVVDPQALIQQYQNEIAELRALLREKETNVGPPNGSRSDRTKNEAMEKRLNELRSLILTSNNVSTMEPSGSEGMARPLSPTKLKYPKLDFDKSTTELQEDLHAAQLKIADQEDEIARLGWELELRPRDVDSRVADLQEEVAGLKLIAADYERHLREPTRKVREDVEREFAAKVTKLESQLESKRIWANRLDENFRAVTAENKELQAVFQIMEWINSALSDGPSISPSSSTSSNLNLPTLVVSQDIPSRRVDDFSPTADSGLKRQSTITLTNSKMTRAQLSMMDLAGLQDRFGSLGTGARKPQACTSMASRGGVFDWDRETAQMDEGDEDEVY
ncbi:P-loop containing nucleoside triphosphate hydrolase protein [Kockovaella imperatae]|uniref:Kinesin-like protein n=1 Tax=Kockovaella imperatae TaxID=4999 RepID=A0A1Y1UGE9_9TREE|nr:P-loop containing nucleoside triphosphate hydrolase protein [Kockovaella imperatae]ORX37049.1 P-loop containing nucleoside triphosphate hydrolase protein [Kockovaella imperatae]